jgi:hypothetical protein
MDHSILVKVLLLLNYSEGLTIHLYRSSGASQILQIGDHKVGVRMVNTLFRSGKASVIFTHEVMAPSEHDPCIRQETSPASAG